MSKFSAHPAVRTQRRPTAGAPGPTSTPDVTVTSGAAVPRIDLAALLGRWDPSAESARPAVSGAVRAVPGRSRTVALSDGTRITFASAATEGVD